MQALARWLVARPLNAVGALAVTMSPGWFGLLAPLSYLSSVVLVLLLLHQGLRMALLVAAAAGALLVVVGAVLKVSNGILVLNLLTAWLPALLLTLLMQRSRSLTLTLQVAWLVVPVCMLLFFASVDDPGAFWRAQIETTVEMLKAEGMHEQAAAFSADVDAVAERLTMFTAVGLWSMATASFVLGYKLERQLPGVTARFGRFRDLNFGRVLALVTAVVSVVAWLGGWVPARNIAFVLLALFWLQGLAIAHWSHGQGFLPTFGLVALYLLMPILNVIVLMGLAVTGYIDAWFGFRRLPTAP